MTLKSSILMNNLALITGSLPFRNRSFLFRNLCLAASFLFLMPVVYGANRYWVAAAAANWSNPLNWSTASGGQGEQAFRGRQTTCISITADLEIARSIYPYR